MGIEDVIVSVNPIVPDKDRDGNDIILTKTVEGAIEKPFGKVLEYMLNPREDSLNPAYEQDQRELADRIRDWKRRAENPADPEHPDRFQLMYRKSNGELSAPVDLNTYIRDYNDLILDKREVGEFEQELKYNGIDLVTKFIPGGGS